VLELDLPVMGGQEVLVRIRDLAETPLLVLSSVDDRDEKVRALRAGADDYLTKPFDGEELVARSAALLRRARPTDQEPVRYADDLVQINFAAAETRVAGATLRLTPLEFRLLTAFVQHPNRVLSPEQLLELAWRDGGGARHRVKLAIRQLRERFRERGIEAPIKTVRGFGYLYAPRELDTSDSDAGLSAHVEKSEYRLAPLEEVRGPRGQRFFPSAEAREELATALGRWSTATNPHAVHGD
jgi:DNA-binding response OmpR family regulator